MAEPFREVQVVAPVGTSFGVVSCEGGVLVLAVRPPGQDGWAHGVEPAEGRNTIREGHTRYTVELV